MQNELRVKFREPSLFEYLLYDLDNFLQKSQREQFSTAWSFLVHALPEDLTLSESQAVLAEFKKLIFGKPAVIIPIRGKNE